MIDKEEKEHCSDKSSSAFCYITGLMFGLRKFERKYKEKKIKGKSKRREKNERKYKINSKSINYFYIRFILIILYKD